MEILFVKDFKVTGWKNALYMSTTPLVPLSE